jgi:hypothetical protein
MYFLAAVFGQQAPFLLSKYEGKKHDYLMETEADLEYD